MSRNFDQEKHGKSEAPVQDLFLRRWSPLLHICERWMRSLPNQSSARVF